MPATGFEPSRAPAQPGPVERPLVSVVVVNWNGERYLAPCLESLVRQTYPRLEIVVVDNGSTDGSLALLRRDWAARVRLVEHPANLGFAGGSNSGIRAAEGEYVALLNNDAVADPGWVGALVSAAESDPAIGMCASRIYVQDRPGVLDSAGLLISRDGVGRGRGRLEPDGAEFARDEDALVPSGCAALYRRAMLDRIGLFDEDFFAYCEDSDLGLRARLAGWRCRYAPSAIVHHRYSGSAGAYSTFKAFHVERNRIWVVVKNFPPALIAASVPWTLARYLVQAYGALRGRGAAGRLADGVPPWALAAVVVRAWAAALARMPEMWRRRRRVQALRRVPRRALGRWLAGHRLGLRELGLKD